MSKGAEEGVCEFGLENEMHFYSSLLIGYAEVMSRQFHVRRADGQKHHRSIESGSRQSPARSIRDPTLQKEP